MGLALTIRLKLNRLICALFLVIIMAWTMYYFWATFIAACQGSPTPWTNFCDSEWADKSTCARTASLEPYSGIPVLEFNGDVTIKKKMESASQQYFDRYVMMKYDISKDFKA